MKSELAAWNNGAGIDLRSWLSCSGSYALAVGYTTLFNPEFVQFEDYILRKGFSIESLRGFENQKGTTPKSVEWVMNHLHIGDIHYSGDDLTEDKALVLGNALKDIYTAKLAFQFPDRPCIVDFYVPDPVEDLIDLQISFWQRKHEPEA